jgi:hypothetical protein
MNVKKALEGNEGLEQEVGGDTKNASNMFKPASLVKTFITEEEQKKPRFRRAAKKAQDIYSQPLNQIEAELFSAPPFDNITEADRKELRFRREEQAKRHAAAKRAQGIYSKASDCTEHPYLATKCVNPCLV